MASEFLSCMAVSRNKNIWFLLRIKLHAQAFLLSQKITAIEKIYPAESMPDSSNAQICRLRVHFLDQIGRVRIKPCLVTLFLFANSVVIQLDLIEFTKWIDQKNLSQLMYIFCFWGITFKPDTNETVSYTDRVMLQLADTFSIV
jgi:hypothetical protein